MEQTITTAIEAAKTLLTAPCASCPSLELKAENLRKSFQSFEKFGRKYKPQKQAIFALNEKKTIMGDYSTLETLDVAYGRGSAASWIVIHLADLNTFIGAKNMTDEQTKDLANIIYSEYKGLKFSVMMLFFFKFKTGAFGKFYGMVDPMVVTCALKDFKSEIYKKKQEYQTEEYLDKVAEEDKYCEAVYRSWYHLCQELFSSIEAKHIDTLSSIDVKKIYVEEKCLDISLSKDQYELLKVTYNDLFSTLRNRYLSNLIWKLRYKITINRDNNGT